VNRILLEVLLAILIALALTGFLKQPRAQRRQGRKRTRSTAVPRSSSIGERPRRLFCGGPMTEPLRSGTVRLASPPANARWPRAGSLRRMRSITWFNAPRQDVPGVDR
jgi:hypothetical protein